MKRDAEIATASTIVPSKSTTRMKPAATMMEASKNARTISSETILLVPGVGAACTLCTLTLPFRAHNSRKTLASSFSDVRRNVGKFSRKLHIIPQKFSDGYSSKMYECVLKMNLCLMIHRKLKKFNVLGGERGPFISKILLSFIGVSPGSSRFYVQAPAGILPRRSRDRG